MNNLVTLEFGTNPIFAIVAESNVALISFTIYLIAVMLLAWLSGWFESKESFVSEYFLGGRNLGVWAFALTFAATSASGGSFVGFPAKIYTHGWGLALWIAGYMLVPLIAMGLLGKRLNRVGRQAGALTIPEVFRERFGSPALGAMASMAIVVFTFVYLLAQFKAGSKILASLLSGVGVFESSVSIMQRVTDSVPIPLINNADPRYLLCLLVFSVAVIGYVVYGGFRAVVWTDVMQGIVMLFGVIVLLYLALNQAGGLANATKQLAEQTPPRVGEISLSPTNASNTQLDAGTWIKTEDGQYFRTKERAELVTDRPIPVKAIQLTSIREMDRVPVDEIRTDVLVLEGGLDSMRDYAFGANQKGTYLHLPGPDPDNAHGFIGMGVAFSFFLYWTFSGAGQPSNMVRLMAFKNTRTLRWSIFSVSLYFSFIYFSLVVIFCCARVILPGLEFDPDRAMPELAVRSTATAGIPWMAGLLLAAPFAAVMSSVDSFLLLVSSSLVRDIYQRLFRPDAPEKELKFVTYAGTIAMGVLATIFAIAPPDYLQDLIVFAGGGLSACFLIPMAFALYWKRMNATGAFAGMIFGFATHLFMTQNQFGIALTHDTGIEAFIWDLIGSTVGVVLGTLTFPRPSPDLIRRFF